MLGPDAHVFGVLREYFQHYGYWTVALMLLLENAGVPAPGEATLLLASVLAAHEHQLQLPVIIVVAVAAAVLGDNAGYAVGYFGGRPLLYKYLHLLHINQEKARKGESFFLKHGALSVFWARFIDGLRIVAGPLAGTLRMRWRRFFLFNFLGALAWVTATVTIGSLFGNHLDRMLRIVRDANLVITIFALLVAASWWWRRHRSHSIQPQTGTAGAD
jgi:membrane protein DedA with SNARE-associated domain